MLVFAEFSIRFCGLICCLGVELYRHVISRRSPGKIEAEEKAPPLHFIRIATEDDFDEAREVMSGEYSNQPVAKKRRVKGKSNIKICD